MAITFTTVKVECNRCDAEVRSIQVKENAEAWAEAWAYGGHACKCEGCGGVEEPVDRNGMCGTCIALDAEVGALGPEVAPHA